jgi:hypothetical protein
MKKALTIATILTVITMPAFAQSADADLGTGNIVPLAATNQGGASAYAQAPDTYETGYTSSLMNRSGHMRTHADNTSVPGASVDKDDTTPKSR